VADYIFGVWEGGTRIDGVLGVVLIRAVLFFASRGLSVLGTNMTGAKSDGRENVRSTARSFIMLKA
jgi:prolipoprotein diacylglyceryltransferase